MMLKISEIKEVSKMNNEDLAIDTTSTIFKKVYMYSDRAKELQEAGITRSGVFTVFVAGLMGRLLFADEEMDEIVSSLSRSFGGKKE